MGKVFKCETCGTRFTTAGNDAPPSPNWADGHSRDMVEVEGKLYTEKDMDMAYDRGVKDADSIRERRMNIIGQNGNDGLNYQGEEDSLS